VNSVAFSPDGKTLASGGSDGLIFLWNIKTQQQWGEPLVGYTDSVNGVTFSPNGQVLASISTGRTIILWDIATRQRLGEPLIGHTSFVNTVAFSPDGKMLASGSDDLTIILWDVDIESWKVRACRIANRNLTQTEWKLYLGDTPYHKSCEQWPEGG
jgi:WD40 repeat protein